MCKVKYESQKTGELVDGFGSMIKKLVEKDRDGHRRLNIRWKRMLWDEDIHMLRYESVLDAARLLIYNNTTLRASLTCAIVAGVVITFMWLGVI